MGYVVKRAEIESPSYWIYVAEIGRGMATVMGHLVRNLAGYWLGKRGPFKSLEDLYYVHTIDYPEEKAKLPPRYRARHRLLPRPDGTPRCVACKCCETTCPAKCIYIEAAEEENPEIEKKPIRFEIDELRCVYCGYCVEACPCDAIRMDTEIVELAEYSRARFILGIDQLLMDIPEKPPVKNRLW